MHVLKIFFRFQLTVVQKTEKKNFQRRHLVKRRLFFNFPHWIFTTNRTVFPQFKITIKQVNNLFYLKLISFAAKSVFRMLSENVVRYGHIHITSESIQFIKKTSQTAFILDSWNQKFKILSFQLIQSGSINYDIRVLGLKFDL